MMVPIQVIRWYRMQCYDGTDSCAIVVPIRRYCQDGRKLLFASGTTEAFKQKFRAAIMYLHEHNADGIIAQIDKSSTIIYITERVGEASAFSKTKKLFIGILTWECLQVLTKKCHLRLY